jgi:Uncharacterized protein conserved in bacteria (DUF2188)
MDGNRPSMADGDIHVVNNGDEWTVTIEGVQGVLVSFDTFDEAVRTARRVAEDARCEVVVHSDGIELADQTAA